MTEQHTPSLPSGVDVARYRELAIRRITYTNDEYGTAKLSAALHVTQQALAEAAAYLAEIPSRGDVGAIRKRLEAVTSQFGARWGYESCGEKGDGSNMVGVLFHPDDENAEHPLLGRCDPIYDEKAAEYRDYYRDELIADVEHRNRCSGAIAEFISHAPSDITTLLAALTASEAERTGAIGDIAAERKRQIEKEGWTAEHDDEHGYGEVARAAAAYAVAGSTPAKDEDEALARTMEQLFPYEPASQLGPSLSEMLRTIETLWPWNWSWWKPTNRRRNLVKAGALIVAEIERLDRKSIP